jgi:hypothetical protein
MASPGKGDGVSTEIEADPDSVEQFEQPNLDNELPPVGPIGPGL